MFGDCSDILTIRVKQRIREGELKRYLRHRNWPCNGTNSDKRRGKELQEHHDAYHHNQGGEAYRKHSAK